MNNLVIVESPAKTKKIQSYLGNGWRVMASYGHFRDLPLKSLGVEPPTFKPVYEASESGKKTLSMLKKAAAEADTVYLATDLDREGEAIAWHIEDALNLKGAKRVTFGEITEKAVKAAIANPRTVDMHLVHAQEGRRVLDRLVGYMVSPALSRKANQSGLSAGRVQSPAVRLVVDREREITTFNVVEHYSVMLNFKTDEVLWSAELDTKKLLNDGDKYLLTIPDNLMDIGNVVVKNIEKKEASRSAPAAFITSTLQQAASISLGMEPKETMKHAQSLFDNGLITYMRTDNLNLSDDAIEEIREYCKVSGLIHVLPEQANRWKSGAGSQEAHEAIRPTDFSLKDAETGDSNTDKIYQLIRTRALASQLKPAVSDTTLVELVAVVDDVDYLFIAKGSVEKQKGWKELLANDDTEEEKEEKPQPLPDLLVDTQLDVDSSKLLSKKTKPPSRYSQAALIKKMEKEGIGRPSTYASIMDNIGSKNYVITEKKKLVPTETGYLVVDALTNKFNFIELSYTKDIEHRLDAIAKGDSDYKSLIADLHKELGDEIKTFSNGAAIVEEFPCPSCGKPLSRREGKFGFFWPCSGYPECKTSLNDKDGKPVEKKKAVINESAPDCPKCDDGKLIRRKGKKGHFWGCSSFPKCKHSANDKNGKPV